MYTQRIVLLCTTLLFASGADASDPVWMLRTPIPLAPNDDDSARVPVPDPIARGEYAMVYDSLRGVTVLFGGGDGLAETFEWDGQAWALRPDAGVAPRLGHAMAFDEARGVTVLFGGVPGDVSGAQRPVHMAETMEWDGTAWAQLHDDSGPSPRYDHAMAYDSDRQVVVLFGGFVTRPDSETWEFDGQAWRQIVYVDEAVRPAPRSAHALAYDRQRRVTVLFGGYNGGLMGDTWEWDGQSWAQRSDSDPSPRSHHAMAFDESRGQVVLFGGYIGYPGVAASDETWAWDGETWQLLDIEGPSARYAHAMAYDRRREAVVLFGGDGPVIPEGLAATWELAPDCNENGLPDGHDIAVALSNDCNVNRVPDECDGFAAAAIIAAASRKSCDLPLNLDGWCTTEARRGGITQLILTFDTADLGAPQFFITQVACLGPRAYLPYQGASTIMATTVGGTMAISFTPALENAYRYRISLGCEAVDTPGHYVELRGLEGDVNSDGVVSAADRTAIVAAWTQSGFTCATDLNADGRTNSPDRGILVGIWTGGESCAP